MQTKRFNVSNITGMNLKTIAHAGTEVIKMVNLKPSDNGAEGRNGAKAINSGANAVVNGITDGNSILTNHNKAYSVGIIGTNAFVLNCATQLLMCKIDSEGNILVGVNSAFTGINNYKSIAYVNGHFIGISGSTDASMSISDIDTDSLTNLTTAHALGVTIASLVALKIFSFGNSIAFVYVGTNIGGQRVVRLKTYLIDGDRTVAPTAQYETSIGAGIWNPLHEPDTSCAGAEGINGELVIACSKPESANIDLNISVVESDGTVTKTAFALPGTYVITISNLTYISTKAGVSYYVLTVMDKTNDYLKVFGIKITNSTFVSTTYATSELLLSIPSTYGRHADTIVYGDNMFAVVVYDYLYTFTVDESYDTLSSGYDKKITITDPTEQPVILKLSEYIIYSSTTYLYANSISSLSNAKKILEDLQIASNGVLLEYEENDKVLSTLSNTPFGNIQDVFITEYKNIYLFKNNNSTYLGAITPDFSIMMKKTAVGTGDQDMSVFQFNPEFNSVVWGAFAQRTYYHSNYSKSLALPTATPDGIDKYEMVEPIGLYEYNGTVYSYENEVYSSHGYGKSLKTFLSHISPEVFTITIANPGVITVAAAIYRTGQRVVLSTTGALPTGLTAGTSYYLAFDSGVTYKIATSYANAIAGTFIETTGTQSGVHTLYVHKDISVHADGGYYMDSHWSVFKTLDESIVYDMTLTATYTFTACRALIQINNKSEVPGVYSYLLFIGTGTDNRMIIIPNTGSGFDDTYILDVDMDTYIGSSETILSASLVHTTGDNLYNGTFSIMLITGTSTTKLSIYQFTFNVVDGIPEYDSHSLLHSVQKSNQQTSAITIANCKISSLRVSYSSGVYVKTKGYFLIYDTENIIMYNFFVDDGGVTDIEIYKVFLKGQFYLAEGDIASVYVHDAPTVYEVNKSIKMPHIPFYGYLDDNDTIPDDSSYTWEGRSQIGGDTDKIKLAAGASTTDDVYNDKEMIIIVDKVETVVKITDYVGSTLLATFEPALTVAPDGCEYIIRKGIYEEVNLFLAPMVQGAGGFVDCPIDTANGSSFDPTIVAETADNRWRYWLFYAINPFSIDDSLSHFRVLKLKSGTDKYAMSILTQRNAQNEYLDVQFPVIFGADSIVLYDAAESDFTLDQQFYFREQVSGFLWSDYSQFKPIMEDCIFFSNVYFFVDKINSAIYMTNGGIYGIDRYNAIAFKDPLRIESTNYGVVIASEEEVRRYVGFDSASMVQTKVLEIGINPNEYYCMDGARDVAVVFNKDSVYAITSMEVVDIGKAILPYLSLDTWQEHCVAIDDKTQDIWVQINAKALEDILVSVDGVTNDLECYVGYAIFDMTAKSWRIYVYNISSQETNMLFYSKKANNIIAQIGSYLCIPEVSDEDMHDLDYANPETWDKMYYQLTLREMSFENPHKMKKLRYIDVDNMTMRPYNDMANPDWMRTRIYQSFQPYSSSQNVVQSVTKSTGFENKSFAMPLDADVYTAVIDIAMARVADNENPKIIFKDIIIEVRQKGRKRQDGYDR